jgi:hypothetical protein
VTSLGRALFSLIAVIILAACASSASTAQVSPIGHPTTPTGVATPDKPCTSPGVLPANWPEGGPVPPQLSGSWTDVRHRDNVIYLHCDDFNISQVIYGKVVVRGSKIDFIQESLGADPNGGFMCAEPSGTKPVLVIEYDWTLTDGQLLITRTSSNLCHWTTISGSVVLQRSSA